MFYPSTHGWSAILVKAVTMPVGDFLDVSYPPHARALAGTPVTTEDSEEGYGQ